MGILSVRRVSTIGILIPRAETVRLMRIAWPTGSEIATRSSLPRHDADQVIAYASGKATRLL